MANEKKTMSIIVHSGTFDKLMPVFMLASTAASMDTQVNLFFTFWGLNALKKGGLKKAKLPGMMSIGTSMMKGRMAKAKVPTMDEMLKMCRETGNVKIYACSTTMELMHVPKENLIPEVDDIVGAATFMELALNSEVNLFI